VSTLQNPHTFALDALERLVRVPSVSLNRESDVHVSASLVASLLNDVGLPEVEVLRTRGSLPSVIARRPARDGAPTLVLYSHHDVQPSGPESEWETPPFQPVVRDGRLFGRGSADNKAAIAIHLAALATLDPSSTVGITVLVEADEEIGSPGAGALINDFGDWLTGDAVIVIDGAIRDPEEPVLTTSLRGLVDCIVEVVTFDRAHHSGEYGGVFPDAGIVLARMLSSLHDQEGQVAIAGLTKAPDRGLERGPNEDELASQLGAVAGLRSIGVGSAARRRWDLPAVSVLAIDMPRIGDASNSLLASARAKISLRLAPGDDPQRAMSKLITHLRANNPWNAELHIDPGMIVRPFQSSSDGPWATAFSKAMADAWGRTPVLLGDGGSLPIVSILHELNPDSEILITGVADPHSAIHSIDESVDLACVRRHCEALTALIGRSVQ
jgi:acetylornithine deacetylase/succinyl-diaminopimelate desuccinylase-like protein